LVARRAHVKPADSSTRLAQVAPMKQTSNRTHIRTDAKRRLADMVNVEPSMTEPDHDTKFSKIRNWKQAFAIESPIYIRVASEHSIRADFKSADLLNWCQSQLPGSSDSGSASSSGN
jgi:hypothetical protein